MRLHSLSLTAVGPFDERQEIDFDRLGSGGLFLFEGPTGVGKSTILDALTFALYGGLASESGDVARMRSDFAEPTVRPTVVLEFSVRGQRHRVTRSPEFRRPKLRGSGTTLEKASVHLERWEEGSWVSRSTSKEEVGTIVTELVGLSRAQFRQVVLLPQGEFASFLRADDDARREVLMKLFGTQFFRRVTDQLQSMAQAARAGVQQAEVELATRVSAAWEACGRPEADVEQAGAALAAQVERLGGLTDALVAAAHEASDQARRAHEQVVGARRDLGSAEAIVERVRRRAGLAADLAEAEAERPAHEARASRARAAHRAAPVRPLVELAALAAERVAEATVRVEEAGVPDPGDCSRERAAEHAARAEGLRAQCERLAPVLAEETGLAARRADLARAREAWAEAREQLAALEGRRDALPAELAALRVQEGDARRVLAGAVTAQAELSGLRSRLQAAEKAAQLEAELPEMRTAQRAARRSYEEVRHAVDLLVERRLGDLRGQLAERLVSGDPCAVCGSTEHPAPAATEATGVSEDDVRAAAAQRDQAELARDEADRAVALAELARDAAVQASGEAPVSALAERIATVEAELAAARRADEVLDGLEARVAALEVELAAVTSQLVPVGQAAALQRDSVERGSAELAAVEARVAAARGDRTSVAQRIEDLAAEADAHLLRAERIGVLLTALDAQREAEGRAQAEALAAGFGSVAEAASAALPPADLAGLDDLVAEWQGRVDRASAQLASADLSEVAGVDLGAAQDSVVGLRATLEQREAAAAEADRAATLAVERRDRFEARLAEVRQCAGAHAAAIAEADEVIALDQYARGMAGTPRMTLVTYVLRYWFDQVVQAANLRLQVMSAGKYELVRADRAERRDARVGLGLSVLDRHTGRERSPGTLSGGETFYTSLALALGLADVVVAQAGGAQLDTLFIDEGFGSLDQETLDDVMGVIDELRGNGRVVGIVSHVPDLKDRIAERLSVRRSRPDGPSRVEVHA